ncbi:MAG: riboflavin synthase [bacterium]
MFTGIISEVGEVARSAVSGAGGRIRIKGRETARALSPGDSVAVEGVCLTAAEVSADFFEADVSAETATTTTLGELRAGAAVNLELATPAGGRLGGHLVQGHVDGVGAVAALKPSGDGYLLKLAVPPEISRYVVEKGSVAVAGISLTAVGVGDGAFGAAIIPYTYENTTFKHRRPGDRINVEVDLIAKYVERFLSSSSGRGLTLERLAELGYGD